MKTKKECLKDNFHSGFFFLVVDDYHIVIPGPVILIHGPIVHCCVLLFHAEVRVTSIVLHNSHNLNVQICNIRRIKIRKNAPCSYSKITMQSGCKISAAFPEHVGH
jgi:hypothetical protein